MNEPLSGPGHDSSEEAVGNGSPATEPPRAELPTAGSNVPHHESQTDERQLKGLPDEEYAHELEIFATPEKQEIGQHSNELFSSGFEFTEAKSVLEFFDFRFRRYLTPWIIRISWLLVLLLAGVWFGIVSWAFLGMLTASDQNQNMEPTLVAPHDFDLALSPVLVEAAGNSLLVFGAYVTFLIGILLILLWIRVIFETIILLYSIANTLRRIDLKTDFEA